MIKFFSQRGRGSLAVILAGCCLPILVGLFCLLLQPGIPSAVAVKVGSICLTVAMATLLGLSLYLSHSEIRSEDIVTLVHDHQDAIRRMQADAGSLHLRKVTFREMSGWDRTRFAALLLLALTFITMGLLDITGIWPKHLMEVRNIRGEMVIMDRWTSGAFGLMGGLMCIIVLINLRIRFEDDWSESLKKLFRDFNIK